MLIYYDIIRAFLIFIENILANAAGLIFEAESRLIAADATPCSASHHAMPFITCHAITPLCLRRG